MVETPAFPAVWLVGGCECVTELRVTAVFSSCAAQRCWRMGGDVSSAGVLFPAEVPVHAHVSSWPLCVLSFPRRCRVFLRTPRLAERWKRNTLLVIFSAEVPQSVVMVMEPFTFKVGTITAWQHAAACALLGSLDGWCDFPWKPLACVTLECART